MFEDGFSSEGQICITLWYRAANGPCTPDILWWRTPFLNAIPDKGYLLVCTSIKLTVHRIYFISTSPVMYKVEEWLCFMCSCVCGWHYTQYCFLLVWDGCLSRKNNWQNKAATHENAFCARLQIRSKETTNTVSSPHRAHKSGWWHTPWIAGWPGVTQIWSDSGFPLMHDNGLHTVV